MAPMAASGSYSGERFFLLRIRLSASTDIEKNMAK